jgi:hypothetical protein
MGSIVKSLAKTVAFIVGIPALLLLAYDIVAVQPRLDQVRAVLAAAPAQDASPPPLVREMIDASSGSPDGYATSLIVSRVYQGSTHTRWHMRNALWRPLLPLHIGESGMYGLYSTLTFNGVDYGLTNFASREFGKPLDALTPDQAATTVAITFAPAMFIKDRERLNTRAQVLLKKSGRAP